MFNQIRYEQQYQQIESRLITGTGNITTYIGRDSTTGQRMVRAADGSIVSAQYLSNSVPIGILPLSTTSAIGLPGYISQKPH